MARGRSRSLPPRAVLAEVRGARRARASRRSCSPASTWAADGEDLEPRVDLVWLLDALAEQGLVPRHPPVVDRPARGDASRSCGSWPTTPARLPAPPRAAAGGRRRRAARACAAATTRRSPRERLAMIRELLPDAAIGTDLIAGFPGEDDAAFERTLRLRRGEPAHVRARLPVLGAQRDDGGEARRPASPPAAIAARARRLRAAGERKRAAFARALRRRRGRGAGRDDARPADRRAARLHAQLPARAPRRARTPGWGGCVPVRLARRRRGPRARPTAAAA